MSSLQDQLSQVAANNATVAFDRKRRQKLHTASLIYNPKTAATQDYDLIFEDASLALEELIQQDSRFQVFTRSLFNSSSVSIDRSQQTAEQVKALDNAINAYLMLVSSKWHLTPTIRATEWIVRRFQVHIHNAEMLLLSTINYYQTPIFKRILNIIKLPPLFSPFSNFMKANENSPSNLTIIKLFNDMDFLKLYTNYLSKVIKQKVSYTSQLLFTSCSFINLIAYNIGNEEKLKQLVPILLEVCAKLLGSSSVECHAAAHTVLVVLATALPLKRQIILAACETIASAVAEDGATRRSALITICKLLQTLKGEGNVDHFPDHLYRVIDSKFSMEYTLEFLGKKETPAEIFATSYLRSITRYDHSKLTSIVSVLKLVELEKYQLRLLITDLVYLSEVLEDKSKLIGTFEYLVSIDEGLVLKCLESLNLTGEIFEVRLTTSLFSVENFEASKSEDLLKKLQAGNTTGSSAVQPFKEFLNKNSDYIYTKTVSLLGLEDEKFSKLLSLFINAIGKKYQPGLFLSSFFTTLEGRITFLLRTIVSPSSPAALRLISLHNLSKIISSIGSDSNLFTLVPILTVALTDVSKNVREAAKKVLQQISKRQYTKRFFMAEKIYGDGLSIPMLSPKDSELWLNNLLDEYLVESYDISQLLVPKKNEKIYLLFWVNQALFIPLPLPKMTILKYLTKHSSYSASYSQLFEPMLSNYLKDRAQWEVKCAQNKTNFKQFETELVSLVTEKEKNQVVINFVLECLKCPHEQLATLMANRLLNIFSTLKHSVQLQIVESIVNTTSELELSYDSIDTLQNLPLSVELFVSILNQNKIADETTTDLTKRRRRRSSSSHKAVLQNEEVSHIAEVHLRKLTIILEALDRMRITGSEELFTTLFTILSDLETLDQDGGLPVLYAQETLASCMLNSIETMKANSKITSLKSIRADILVTAIRASPSPQLQNKLLLVIGALATLNPEVVLHSIMPIFTFMGAHSIRQDDEFSTLVVEKTIKTVVPALLESGSSTLSDELEFLLISFTTAFSHVPKHRRVRLYTTLVQTLGPENAISPFLFLIAQSYSNSINHFSIADAKSTLEFSKKFLSNFSVIDQLNGLSKLFELLRLLSDISSTEGVKQPYRTLFSNGVLNFTSSELFNLKKNAFDYIDNLVSEESVDYHNSNGTLKLRILSALTDPQSGAAFISAIIARFGALLNAILEFINNVESICQTGNSSISDAEGSFTEAESEDRVAEINEVLFSLLSHVLDLLPTNEFVQSVSPLLNKGNSEAIRHHLILAIGSKFDLEPIQSAADAESVISMLFGITTGENESPSIIQVALNTVSILITKFGSQISSTLLTESLKVGVQHLSSERMDIIISALSVLTNTVHILGVKSIAFYPKIVPRSLEIFASVQDTEDELKEQTQLSVLLMFAAMIKRMPSFLLSNLLDVFKVVFFADDVQDSIRLYVISLIVQHIDLKEVIKTLHKVWILHVCKTEDSVAVSMFLSTLESTVEAIDKKSAANQAPNFFKLSLALFEYRAISSFDNNTISRIEATTHEVVVAYVLKLNDKVFRQLFALTARWAFDGECVTNTTITKVERLVAFYKFYNKLQDNLKSIITSYFNYLLEPTNNLLKDFISGTIQDTNLRRLVLISLNSSFKYDRDEYWRSSTRFELISTSLVNQIANIPDVIGKYLVKAITALAVNNSEIPEHNKIINGLLIQHMKSDCQTKQKLWAVKSIKLIYAKVGEKWLVLLPQLVPIIAELLEDDDEQVEQEVRTGLVKVVENVLGEPFDRYLN
ncbi:HBR458Wp [Eremothecium sinecaudum]|uniref:U3 small nucleolar RNA-associated protein 10 n=1 Tax=Eremothecium sinecaudum TaxID=45286 RepID=A0A109UXK9_9SACH|nr:HBR458Wp [Eremothecium sinecaudum]AMD19359.1 HBR458Wp [Eremothecium sinecaudum]